ncbi:amino acid adenylation domain-containing protein [Tumebacillus sp. ITR2]|uniref:Amino acid adenylation domain-containing protein n=1 Tax=Tumebacillus amylolyticus TaxID=2801339 RepID=A0ABS1J9Y9_9BACL|nr:non-ribosomal peptide synthetase [Tumebacillus amylolyticus]MBL0387099.1 amino acid adenylation domain-containing protein [Tumebacillus amylolyticus]
MNEHSHIIHHLFNEQVEKTPDHVAVSYGSQQVTYREIQERSNRLAHFLQEQGVERSEPIAILLERSVEMVVTLLGVLKAGAAFVPLDPKYPLDRLTMILSEVSPKWVISQRSFAGKLQELVADAELQAMRALYTDEVPEERASGLAQAFSFSVLDSYSSGNLEVINEPGDLNYIFYTSGSTGRPKGVMGCHKSLAHFIRWEAEEFGIGEGDRVSQFAALSFDASLRDIFVPLCNGGRVCLPPQDVLSDRAELVKWIESEQLTIIHCVPSVFRLLLAEAREGLFPNLRHILMAGEVLDVKHVRRWMEIFGTRIQLVNFYGSTETTMIKMFHRIEKLPVEGKPIPIGRGMKGAAPLILNVKQKLCGIGQVGEIYIRSPFLSLGYYKRPELTAEVFLQNPLRPVQEGVDPVYRTGDLGRYLPDGSVEYIGRRDNQVKVRGIRVELAEIEAAMVRVDGLREAVVVARTEEEGDCTLIAYFTGEEITVESLRASLQQKLPDVMIPSQFHLLAEMPLLPNGKVDRKGLQAMALDAKPELGTQYVAPSTETERVLADIWAHVLKVEKVGVADSFFALGGHSLLAMQVLARVQEATGLRVTLQDFFAKLTVGELAAHLDGLAGSKAVGTERGIVRLPEQSRYALSHAQRRLWFLQQLDLQNVSYHMPYSVVLKGNLDLKAFEAAVARMVERHGILRTVFLEEEGVPYQVVRESVSLRVQFEDLAHLNPDEQEQAWRERMAGDAATPFSLTDGPLTRMMLFRTGAEAYRFYINTHHIISDGWSTGLFVQELAEFYHALTHGQEASLVAGDLRYVDFAAWQNELLATGQLDGEEAYWLETLAKPLPTLNLPLDFERPTVMTDTGAQFAYAMDGKLVERARKFAQQEEASLFMVLLSAYHLLLHRLSGDEDIIVGTPTAGRTTSELESLLGVFINMLSIRARFDAEDTFRGLLQQVKARCVEAYDHQTYPFDRLIEKVQPERDLSRSAVFSTMFVFENTPFALKLPGLEVSPAEIHRLSSQFDLALKVLEHDGETSLYFEYNPDLFLESTVAKMAEQYVRLLSAVLGDAEQGLYEADLLTEMDKQVYAALNETAVAYDLEHLLLEAFVEQAERHPERIALSDPSVGRTMTYGELHERSNQVAHYLRAQGAQRNQLVAIMMERSVELMVGLYGILKSGAAYVPIDPEYPAQRIQYMLADSGARVLLTKRAYMEQVVEKESLQAVLLMEENDLSDLPTSMPEPVGTPDDLAYMIYTSGSTGQPKGVLIQHRAILNRLHWHQEEFPLTPEDVVIQRTTVCFDDSVIELFWPLRHGAVLSIMPQDVVLDSERLIGQLVQERATYMQFVPSLLTVVVSALQELPASERPQLHTIIVSGEALPSKLVEQWFTIYPTGTKLVNMYGPTEAAVDVSFSIYEGPQKHITIGQSVANTQLYVLNPQRRLCPVNVAGELYVGGVQLAVGYHNKPEKTAESFVSNSLPGTPGNRLYRTGDSVRLLPDGNIDYLGRIDNQVKVRGFRIELGEIEEVLSQYPDVVMAVVLARKGSDGINSLFGFYTANRENVEAAELKEHLRIKLPDYMIPPRLVQLERMPLTPNGKVDRKALVAMAGEYAVESGTEYVAPSTPTEEALASIWSELLGREQVGAGDHFFELGGHSLLLMQVNSRIRKTLGVGLELKELFAYPTLAELAAHVESRLEAGDTNLDRSAGTVRIEPAPIQPHYELSHAQKRLWFLQKFDPENVAYHVNLNIRLKGEIHFEKFAEAFDVMIRRHSSLRTVFREVDGMPRQFVQDDSSFALEFADWTNFDGVERESRLRAKLRETEAKPFDFSNGPLMRAMLYRTGEAEYQFLLQKHHIITDALSRDLFLRELQEVYAALVEDREPNLPAVELQYTDYAEWQAAQAEAGVFAQEQEYWVNVLAKPLPILDLPTDFPRPEVQTYNGGLVSQVLSADLVEHVRKATQLEGVSMFMFLFAAYVRLLNHLSGSDDIVVGTTIAGRTAEQLESVFGFFVNTLALRVRLDGVQTAGELVQEVKRLAVEAYDHQSVPFDLLIERINPERDMSRSPIFSTMFQYEIGMAKGLQGKHFALELTENPFEVLTSKFDLQLNLMDFEEQGLHLFFQYNSDLFTQETVEKFTALFLQVVESFTTERTAPLGAVTLLTEGDLRVYERMNETAAAYDNEHLLLDAFIEQAESHPERVALSDPSVGRTMTYGELHARSNRLAHFLRGQGVERNQLVAILMERSVEMMVGLYGILKSGAAYVPIDPEYPAQRIQYMLEDSGARVLLTKQAYLEQVETQGLQAVLLMDTKSGSESVHVWNELQDLPTSTPEPIGTPDDLAYMIYTSGSTGQPKGVLIQHRAILNRLNWHQDTFHATPADVIIQRTTVCFDDSVIELFWPLRHGATLSIMPQEIVLDPKRLIQQLLSEKATYMQFVPSLLAVVVSAIQEMPPHDRPNLRTLIVSGEALPSKLVEHWFTLYPTGTKLANLYGPTEAAVDVSGAIYEGPQGLITIGKPLANTQLYVLNTYGQLCPVNVKGELYVGGVQLALGYHNKPEKTAESFVPNSLPGTLGDRLYRTGDAVRLLPDGTIEYLGRVDNQVKIRGFRIELGEIEEVLTQHPSVEMAAVIARTGPDGNKALFGYYTASGELGVSALKDHLRAKLPDYMVPPRLVQLDVMPLTPNGKVDRKALEHFASQDSFEIVAEYIAPSTPTEKKLAAIWGELLKREQVGVSDNFFDLGGHSLLAIQILNRVRNELHTSLELKDLFANPTVDALAATIDERLQAGETETSFEIPKAPEKDHYPLSNAQRRLWLIHKMNPESRAYHVPLEISIKRALDVKLFEKALHQLVERQEALRTVFIEVTGEPRQQILPKSNLRPFFKDLSNKTREEQDVYIRETIALNENRPFDLAKGPLVRTLLFKLAEEHYHFYLNLHHIITDGWSNELLAREHAALYEALVNGEEAALADLPIQYADYAEWQEQEVENGRWAEDESYWLDTLAKPLPLLDLPTDFPRPEVRTDNGSVLWWTIPQNLTTALRERATEEEVSLYTLLLAGYVLFLHKQTRQEDIIVGTPIAGRMTEALEPIIGFFVNTLAIRTRLAGVRTGRDLIQTVKEQFLSAYGHQGIPFDLLIEKVNPERDLSRSPIFSTMFTYRQFLEAMSPLYEPMIETDSHVSKFDLTVSVNEENDEMRVSFEYNTDLFKKETVESFAASWQEALELLSYEPTAQAITAVKEKSDSQTTTLPSNFGLSTDEVATESTAVPSTVEISNDEAASEPTAAISPAERALLLQGLNPNPVDFPADDTLQERFERQVTATPDALAVTCEGLSWTYSHLNSEANRIAHLLRQRGVAEGMPVVLVLERSLDMIAAILGVVKAGGVYVPVDPDYPEERITYIVEDSGAQLLLLQGETPASLREFQGTVLSLDQDRANLTAMPDTNPTPVINADSLIYAIYTSGSTGKPKGVLLTHRNVARLMDVTHPYYNFDSSDVWTMFHSYCFDFSVWEMYGALLYGGRVVIVPKVVAQSTSDFYNLLLEENVTVLNQTPSAFYRLIEADGKNTDAALGRHLRHVIFGGEALNFTHLRPFLDRYPNGPQLVNMYGITETTVHATYRPISRQDVDVDWKGSPIGVPLDDLKFYLLDENSQLVPRGEAGEIYIAGPGLAARYLNNPDKTAEVFLEAPLPELSGTRLYKTGDLARIHENGELEYLGRVDHQVKIRGFRIELGEIENTLARHDDVKNVLVVASPDAHGDLQLLAYLETDADHPAKEWRRYVRQSLPEYMIPAVVIAVPEFPMTPNGKIDRKALQALDVKKPPNTQAAAVQLPANELEAQLVDLWKDALQHEDFGLQDNFFDVGGHSFALVKVGNGLQERLDLKVPLTDLFKYPTIQSLSEALVEQSEGGGETEPSVEEQRSVRVADDAVAIIGISLRLPDASTPHEFWENLRNGHESVREFPVEEVEDTPFNQDPEVRAQLVRVAAILDDIDKFDASFFGIPEKEARLMNPQHRLFLECAWEAIEDAGYNVDDLRAPVSVYGGCGGYEYLPRQGVPNLTQSELFQGMLASQPKFLTTRVSYKLNLSGESMLIDTGCSTSLVAVHMACRSLLEHQSDFALAGGASVALPQKQGFLYEPGFVNSEDGHCRAFDKDATGTANGSGVGMVFLKRLSDAVRDGDPIYAVIRGSAINNDGSFKIGYTAPSQNGQAQVIAKAQAAAGVKPDDISYIEAHGTGTTLGDPIEVAALTEVFRRQTDRRQFCALGSIKTNVGHLDAAAGVAGLIKTALALKHRELPPSLNFKEPNPALNLETSPFYVNAEHRPWVVESGIRRAGVSAFGIGGTNAHVILEEPPVNE